MKLHSASRHRSIGATTVESGLSVTTVPFLIAGGVVIAAAVGWLVILTIAVVKLLKRSGEPVYRRLGNGRIRFRWGVAQAFVDTRRRHPTRSVAAGLSSTDRPAASSSSTMN